jgi:hypothetical protein
MEMEEPAAAMPLDAVPALDDAAAIPVGVIADAAGAAGGEGDDAGGGEEGEAPYCIDLERLRSVEGQMACPGCGKAMRKSQLMIHMRNKKCEEFIGRVDEAQPSLPPITGKVKCPSCPHVSPNLKALRKHYASQHGDKRACAKCGKEYGRSDALRKHEKQCGACAACGARHKRRRSRALRCAANARCRAAPRSHARRCRRQPRDHAAASHGRRRRSRPAHARAGIGRASARKHAFASKCTRSLLTRAAAAPARCPRRRRRAGGPGVRVRVLAQRAVPQHFQPARAHQARE